MLSLYNDQCVEYNGVCTQYLPPRLDNETSLFTLKHHGISDHNITNFMNVIKDISVLINEQCHDAVLPFLCQYVFPPCNVSGGNKNLISQAQCTNIRDVVCSFEWSLAIMNMPAASTLLPTCENFDDNDNYDNIDDDDNNDTVLFTPKPLQCHYQFKEFCGLCLPLCGKFSQYKAQTKLQERAVIIFAGIAAFIGGILVFLVSVYRWKIM